jgi:hypothetical protein
MSANKVTKAAAPTGWPHHLAPDVNSVKAAHTKLGIDVAFLLNHA